VCRAWNTTVGEHLITQLCCDIDHLPSIRHLPGLRHIIVEGVFDKLCGRQYKQQCLFVHARLAAAQDNPVTMDYTRVRGFPAPRGDLSPLAALPGVQAVTLRCLPLLTRNFQQQAAHLTHLTSLTLHQPQYEDIAPFKSLREALSALPQLKALALINLQESVVQPVLTPAKRQRSTTAAAAAVAAAAAQEAAAVAGSSGVETAGSSSSAAAEEGREQRPCSSSSSNGALVRAGSASLGSSRSAGHVTSTSSSSAAAVAQQEATAGPSSSSSSSGTSLPCPWLGNLRSLTIRITDLPDLKPALASLTSCTHLDLSHCSLDGDLPSSLGQLTQLEVGAWAAGGPGKAPLMRHSRWFL
jgi:Leucine-rich repeat (LRR) protein